jgi:hypothetical protein
MDSEAVDLDGVLVEPANVTLHCAAYCGLKAVPAGPVPSQNPTGYDAPSKRSARDKTAERPKGIGGGRANEI